MQLSYCIRTFGTQAEAEQVRDALLQNYGGQILCEYSNLVERWTLKCAEADARALYVRSMAIAPIETP